MARARFDVFLSYASEDGEVAAAIAEGLEEAGLQVWRDAAVLTVGDRLLAEIDKGLLGARYGVVILSPVFFDKGFTLYELESITHLELGKRKVMLPVWHNLTKEDVLARSPALADRLAARTDLGIPECVEQLLAAIRKGARRPTRGVARSGLPQPVPRMDGIIHGLPPAPHFVGRRTDLRALAQFWKSPTDAVLSIVGIGGCGKTALVERFLSQASRLPEPPADRLFIWSFYNVPDTEAFLEVACTYFMHGTPPDAKGAAWLHLLKDALGKSGRSLLIFDGLERIQRTEERSPLDRRSFGELEDPLLRELLTRLVVGDTGAKTIITSRFPITDLERWRGHGYVALELDQLDRTAALALLRSHGVTGDDAALDGLFARFGRHALTLDHLGSLLGRYFDGDPSRASELTPIELRGKDAQARRLRAVLEAYQRYLPENELAVLVRLCVFPSGVTLDLFCTAFLCAAGKAPGDVLLSMSEVDAREILASLVEHHLVIKAAKQFYTVHPAIRDYFYRAIGNPRGFHDVISARLQTLTTRPSGGYPTKRSVLDLHESLIYHLLQAGKRNEARAIYFGRLGGAWHLTTIGEFARGYRILSQFPTVIDFDGYLRFRRGIGDLPSDKEWEEHRDDLTFFSALGLQNTRLLRGDLARCDLSAARFLQGKGTAVLYSSDFAPRFSAVLLAGATAAELRSRVSSAESPRLGPNGPANDAVANLWLAESMRMERDLEAAQEYLERARRWVLRTSSVEHLCILHLVSSRLALDSQDFRKARSALEEGLVMARRARLLILLVDLLNVDARLCLAQHSPETARTSACDALETAMRQMCQYIWGAVSAESALVEAETRLGLQSSAEHSRALERLRARLGQPDLVERMLECGL